MDLITIRPLTTIHEAAAFQELERLIWNNDDVDAVPIHVLITVVRNGGLLLGAFAPDGPTETGGMVGAAFGWLGVGVDPATPEAGMQLKFCSHMVGVAPTHQNKRVGLRLKLAQREHVLAQGLTNWITWTYDPLFSRNGMLNLHRLGATCRTYIRNIYGELNDDLNRGVPSDRCQVDWRLTSPHVLHRLNEQPNAPTWDVTTMEVLPASTDARGLRVPGDPTLGLDGRPLAVPVPDDISLIRRTDRELGMAWRYYMREVLETAFAAGYTLVDCVRPTAPDGRDLGWRYILVREYM